MSKAKEPDYEYVRAIVDCGELRWEYKLKGMYSINNMTHDEDISDWSEEDIIKLTRNMLDMKKGEKVEVVYG